MGKRENQMYMTLWKKCVDKNIQLIVIKIYYVVFTPREVSESCQIFRDLYDEYNLEEFFMKRVHDNGINFRLCQEKTTVEFILFRYVKE